MATAPENTIFQEASHLLSLDTIITLYLPDGSFLHAFYVAPLDFYFIERWNFYQLYYIDVELNAGVIYDAPQFGWFTVISLEFNGLIANQAVVFIPLEDIEIVGPF